MSSSTATVRNPRSRDVAPEDLIARPTPRQIECLSWVQEGKTSWEIGRIMGISERTVESYLAIACERLKVRKRVQAVVRAQQLGLI